MRIVEWTAIGVVTSAACGCTKWRNIHLVNQTDQVVHIDVIGGGEKTLPEAPWLSLDLPPGGKIDYIAEHAEEHGATQFKWTGADGRAGESGFIVYGLSMVTLSYEIADVDGRLVLRDKLGRIAWPADVAANARSERSTP